MSEHGYCDKCGKDLGDHPTVNVEGINTLALCQDRAIKWVKVEAGFVFPKGSPYRIEHPDGTAYEGIAGEGLIVAEVSEHPMFRDSSWKPPLVLPAARSLILAEVDDRYTEDKVLLTGPHRDKGNTWWSFDTRLSLIPDDINSFEVLWTEDER